MNQIEVTILLSVEDAEHFNADALKHNLEEHITLISEDAEIKSIEAINVDIAE